MSRAQKAREIVVSRDHDAKKRQSRLKRATLRPDRVNMIF
jgi:hypothetical protein